MTSNPHQPITEEHRISCAAPGCIYAMHTYKRPEGGFDWAGWFRDQHTEKHEAAPIPITDLACDACASTAPNLRDAIAHVTANPGHAMTAEDSEGTTTRVTIADDEDEDDDWNAADQ